MRFFEYVNMLLQRIHIMVNDIVVTKKDRTKEYTRGGVPLRAALSVATSCFTQACDTNSHSVHYYKKYLYRSQSVFVLM